MGSQMNLSPSFLLLVPFLMRFGAGHSAVLGTLLKDSTSIADSYGVPGVPDGYNAAWYSCYETLCWCSGHVANCSDVNLTYIPKLPDSITYIIFNYNEVTEIRNCTFFVNVTNITALEFRGNGLVNIVPDAFCLLTKLENLTVSNNPQLNSSTLPAIFSITTLQILNISDTDLGPLANVIFYNHTLSNLHSLYLHASHVSHCGGLNLSVFVPIGSLTYLDLSGNKITDIFTDQMNSLDILEFDLSLNVLDQFLDTCSSNRTSLFPRLTRLVLKYNYISSVPRDVCLPALHILDLSENYLGRLEEEYLHIHMFQNLTNLYLLGMHARIKVIGKNAFQSTTLRNVSLMFNWLDFGNSDIDPGCFAGIPKLSSLQLSHNFFDRVSDAKWDLMFGSLTNLQDLYIDNAYVSKIPHTFSKLKSLEKLSMGDNDAANIPEGVFDTQPNLTFLQLNSNRISVIPQSTFSPLTRQQLSHLDLSGNPFTCSCDVMWFRDWLLTVPGLFQPSWSTYECDNVADTNVTSFYMSEQACLISRDTARFVTVIVSLLLSSVTVLTLLYRYRWHLRLVVYEAFRGPGEVRRRRLQRQDFLYDLFVSYAATDLPWVRTHLMPQLEDGLGLRLCLHDRDFILGHPIVDNIEESVRSSKKVLMLFSLHFARSEWCQFELTLCLSHVMEHEDALLVVLLYDMPTHDLTSAMMAVLRTTTFIEWAQHTEAVASFWGRMRIALQEILPSREQHRFSLAEM